MLQRRLLAEWLLVLIGTLAAVLGCVGMGVTTRLDHLIYDRLVWLRAASPDPRILIVTIDDDSLKQIGRWPWPRNIHAEMLSRLAPAKPALVAYDVLYTEPSADDAALAAAMRTVPTIVPLAVQVPGLNGAPYDVIMPVPPVAAAARGVGHVNVTLDSDGLVRMAAMQVGKPPLPHLMALAYRRLAGKPSPLEEQGLIGIPFGSQAGRFPSIAFSRVLSGEVPAGLLKDRIILIGSTAPGLGDTYPVPIAGNPALPGVELQAEILNALIANRAIRAVDGMALAILSLLPMFALMAAFWHLSPRAALWLSLGMIAATLGGSAALLGITGLWIAPGAALIGLLIVYPIWGWRRLQAISSYIDEEVSRLRHEPIPEIRAAPTGPGAMDFIGAQAAEMRLGISYIRDLRRFVSDALSGLPDAVLVTDSTGAIIFANPAAEERLGKPLEGQAADAVLARGSGATDAVSARPVGTDDLVIADRSYSVARTPFYDATGEQRGWIIRLTDITPIRASARTREETLQWLSHDMRAPQASILALIDGPTERKPAEIIRRIRGHAERTLRMADNFVHLARVSELAYRPAPMSLGDALTEAIEAVWATGRDRHVRILREDTDEDPAEMLGEADAIDRALVNLLDNAVRHSPPDSVVRCRIDRIGDRLRCQIADAGPGLPPEQRGSLFRRFGTGASPDRRSAGLGLAYVRAVAERHGGTVDYHDAQPHGAVFVIEFPAGQWDDMPLDEAN